MYEPVGEYSYSFVNKKAIRGFENDLFGSVKESYADIHVHASLGIRVPLLDLRKQGMNLLCKACGIAKIMVTPHEWNGSRVYMGFGPRDYGFLVTKDFITISREFFPREEVDQTASFLIDIVRDIAPKYYVEHYSDF